MTHGPSVARSDGVELELAALRGRVAMVEAELVAARATRDQLTAEFERLRVDNQRLRSRVGELAAQVEQLRRASKRQAAPFSKGTTVPRPRRPGRKAGTAYGHHARRPVPDPDRVSRVVDVGLPEACPTVAARSASSGWPASIKKTSPAAGDPDLPLHIQIGRFRRCRRRVQPRHPEQTSQASGAAGVQVGPRAVALAAWASKGLGLLAYAAAVGAAMVAFVHGYEEPTLRGQFGAQYEAYRHAVPAWWPRRHPWQPGQTDQP